MLHLRLTDALSAFGWGKLSILSLEYCSIGNNYRFHEAVFQSVSVAGFIIFRCDSVRTYLKGLVCCCLSNVYLYFNIPEMSESE